MSRLTIGLGVTKRTLGVIMLMFLCLVSWYFTFLIYVLQNFNETLGNGMIVGTLFNLFIGISLIAGSFLVGRLKKLHVIEVSSLLTTILSILLLVLTDTILKLAIVFSLAVSFGLCQLAFLSLFWSLTRSEERGRVAGISGLLVLPLASVAVLIAGAGGSILALELSIFFGLGTFAGRILGEKGKMELADEKDERTVYPEKRTIILFVIPWILFTLVNQTLARSMAINMGNVIPSDWNLSFGLLQFVASGLGALVGGLTADFIGRRPTIAFCLTLYGFALVLGTFVQNYYVIAASYAMNGLNWGFLWVLYTAVVWGDLADRSSVAKRYSLGLAIYYLASALGIFLTPWLAEIPLLVSALLGCSLIFMSNAPLVLAPELLSTDFREKLKLKSYVRTVKKIGKKRSRSQG